ncbi:fungal-specific transcription factor domain-containing protein [Aspergillus granulosus]|uniref:Fungal-specific transcription factor domain-containing protein n=1 Tax=Aspergillus granulosus TaxID=176169 RepID=A0ABR4H5D5_9EURO
MEIPPGHPQAGGSDGQGDSFLQPRSENQPSIVPVANPPSQRGSALPIPRGPPSSARSTTLAAGRKQMASNHKVAIPRQRTGAAPRYSRRVPLACETCRLRKTKCSGDTPICRQCAELRVECRYPISWRERTKGELAKLSAKSEDYESLLREISCFVDGRTSERIKNVLDKYSEPVDGTLSDQQSANSAVASAADEEPEIDAESLPSSIGSLDAIDRVDEDLNRSPNSRATGYMGKNSEVTWLQRLRREAEHRARKLPGASEHKPEHEFSIHSVNYHLDDVDISPPGPVHLYWIPPRNVADKLFEDYLDTIHPVFPILGRTLFSAQYRNFFDNSARPGDKWLAILNLIFAIASYHAHLMQAPWRGDECDHLVYLARARALSLNSDALFTHPDLQQVQVEALMAFYLLSTDQINRSWRIASLALRSGISLGLNLRNSSEATPDVSKEARYRVWWCLYTFEHLLGIMTGRMTGISDGICTTPMPLPVGEERFQDPKVVQLLGNLELRQERVESALASSFVRQMPLNPQDGRDLHGSDKIRDTTGLSGLPHSCSLFFLYHVDLAVITQEVINRVYSLDCIMIPWSQIENRIGELRARIELWHSNLPKVYDWRSRDEQSPDLLRARLCLAFGFYSARITLGRPCLCRRDIQNPDMPFQKKTFTHEIAVTVLDSAQQLVGLLPDVPDASSIYQLCPWWCVLHYLMQATTVLLLELSFGSIHMPNKEGAFLEAAKKAIRWIHAMSKFSAASRRAWELCDGNLRRLATSLDFDVSDIPTADYQFDLDDSGRRPHNHLQDNPNPKPHNPVSTNPPPSPTPILHFSPAGGAEGQPKEQHPPPQDPTTLQHVQPPSMSLPGYAGAASLEALQNESPFLFPLDSSSGGASNDTYFPYDPITGEFIRSFFPASYEEESWNGKY